MDLKHLDYLLTIVKYKNITQAADELYITPSALSKYLTNLENEIKLPIFYRNGHTLELTKYGKVLVRNLNEIEQINSKIDAELADMSSQFSSRFRIGFQTSIDNFIIRPIFNKMLNKFPAIKYSLVREHQENLVDKIKNYELDAAIVTLDEDLPNLAVDELVESEFVLVTNKAIKLPFWQENRKYPLVKFSDIKNYPLVSVVPGRRFGDYVLKYFSDNSAKLDPKIQVSTTDIALDLVSKDNYCTFASELFVKKSHYDNLECFSFGKYPVINKFCLITRKHKYSMISKEEDYFRKLCHDEFILL
ncbi:DNA-binding transcriptional LysR family regulator [Lactobacillus colini]|uniref:DNA-binding transcriptional LysR family regulator n=1 Tax=Lactobacillus colini TaxID=1819254 RepID=A0ABS4MCK3_9LACO|nr:LysR family transcriptional regulator [Lactobacillus colini]MBP2057124.1 DNA-binding transcriptional LysR family regulator [Lactobacillus colini]